MKYALPYSVIVLVLLYGLYNAYRSDAIHQQAHSTTTQNYLQHTAVHTQPHLKDELSRMHTVSYRQRYITDIINHGSSQLHFKSDEVMEGGFASRQDAPDIACYVISLAGEKCAHPYRKEAAMFYSSNCGGCHGEDGKGLHGTYPDLTRRPLLGIEKREAFLKHQLRYR